MDKKAFSLVEIIITVTLLVLLATVGFSMAEKYQQNKTNTKVQADLATLSNAFTSYKTVEKKFPDPIANKNYFTSEWMYTHDETSAFWVHGFITSETLPNKYLNFVPVDIKTNQYYAFWKTIDNSGFEIAWVLQKDGDYMSKVYGDYTWETGPYNLIREYNGPSFVADESPINFPYNPDEKLLTAKVGVFSGSVSINGTLLSDEATITSTILRLGDIVKVGPWDFATLYFSDGSMSTLWDITLESELVLANMTFVEDNNLYTQIKLALKVGSLWTSAAKLDSKSSFEVYTTDTSAAVRGTIFGVTKEVNSTTITVVQGEVEVKKISFDWSSFTDLITAINDQSYTSLTINGLPPSPWITPTSWNWILIEPTGTPIWVKITLSFSSLWTETNDYDESVKLKEKEEKEINNKTFITNSGTETESIQEAALTLWENILREGGCENEDQIYLGWECIDKELSIDDDYELVAYAPYNGIWDILLYSSNPITTHSGMVLWNSCSPNYSSFSFTTNTGGCESGGNTDYSPYTFDVDNSYFSTPTIPWFKGWVFLDNNNNDNDFIKYSWLNSLWQNFAIEMSVRGGALKKPSDVYYLYSNWAWNNNLKLHDWKLKLYDGSLKEISYSSINIPTDNYNNFYRVIYKKDWSDVELKIVSYTWSTVGSKQWSWIYDLWNDLYIWSKWTGSTNSNQWNDIIDYVKIYKKNTSLQYD